MTNKTPKLTTDRLLITQGELDSGNITNLLNGIFLERIAVLLKAMESFSPTDNRPVDKALERHGVRMDGRKGVRTRSAILTFATDLVMP